jgi:hypothetical protein
LTELCFQTWRRKLGTDGDYTRTLKANMKFNVQGSQYFTICWNYHLYLAK